MGRISFKVEGLDCAEEVILLKKALEPALGVKELGFNIFEAKMIVHFDPTLTDEKVLIALIKSTGMKATVWVEDIEEKDTLTKSHGRLILTCLSGLFLLTALCFHYFHELSTLTRIFYGTAIFFGVWLVIPKAYNALRRLSPDMNLLMVIAVAGAIGIHEWLEAATVSFLFSLALLLEHWSVQRARKAIFSLMELAPKRALVIHPETKKPLEYDVSEVEMGSLILVKPGEKIPLDAVIERGSSSIDQSSITGESIAVYKEAGDEVFAGTLNGDGALECRVLKIASESTLARMVHLVQQARSKRSESEQWVETFARFYTPIMLLFACVIAFVPPLLFSASWQEWIYRGLVLLVIACPCALVISTPVSIVSGLTAAARAGVLIKGGVFLEQIGQLKAFALDKTGTLTVGHPEVQKIVPLNGHTETELMQRAIALEKPSTHPLARAVLRKGQEMGIEAESASNFQSIKGKGALATYHGKLYWIGSHRFMHEMKQETDEVHKMTLALEDEGHSIVAIGTDDHVCGIITVADSPREEIKNIIQDMKKAGIKEIVMLTGDNEQTAKALASYSGVDRFHAELLPEEKVEAILALTKTWEKVGMVGDGVNDAPALASATVGFAMGKMGTDTAIETADVTLMSDDLSKIPWLIRHSRRTLRMIKQNIAFSLGVKALFIALALFNAATLWMAIAADTGATILVIFNALRLIGDNRLLSKLKST